MQVIKNIEVPTGNILIVEGDAGNLECLSIGDYGKDVNIKADFLGLSRDIGHVEHTDMLPLEDKWVITISSQYGCSMNCKFCDVPKVGPGRNATYNDLLNQVLIGLSMHPEVTHTNRLNIHFARMGEPTWNPEVLRFSWDMRDDLFPYIGCSVIHPVVSTMMPHMNTRLLDYIREWCEIKNECFKGEAGLQLSINSTSDTERQVMFNGNSMTLSEISNLMDKMPAPVGRKYTLNFAVAGYEINGKKLAKLFNPDHFIVKLTPMHKTATAISNNIKTEGDYTTFYPYHEAEQSCKDAGFDTLVFIASEYEDLGRITCGNAILSGTLPNCPYTIKES